MSLYAPRTSSLLSFEFLLHEYHHDDGNVSEKAALIVSSASLNLLMQEDLDVSEGLEIFFVGHLREIQWRLYCPKLKLDLS